MLFNYSDVVGMLNIDTNILVGYNKTILHELIKSNPSKITRKLRLGEENTNGLLVIARYTSVIQMKQVELYNES